MSENVVTVYDPTQFGVGDGATNIFSIGAPREVVTSISPSGVWRLDWQGNQWLYPTPRTNLVSRSFAAPSGWGAAAGSVLTPNYATAPDGSKNAGFLGTSTPLGAYAFPGTSSSQSYTAGVRYTASVWFKRDPAMSSKQVRLLLHSAAFGVHKEVYFNVQTGAVVGGANSPPQGFGSTIYPDGWTRVWVSDTASVTTNSYPPLVWFNQNIVPGEGVAFWGMQLEAGPTQTAYIETNGSPVTVTDYAASPAGLITMGQVPAIGAALTWTGSYTYKYQDDAPTLADRTVISQYTTSPTLRQLIRNLDEYINPDVDFDAFYNYVWNVETAQGFGLDIWGRIVGVERILTVPGDVTYLGYAEASSWQPFNQAPMYAGEQATQTYRLADDAYRRLILVKALANITDCTSPSLNRLLSNLFAGRGRCYVSDTGKMEFRYVFEFALEPYEIAILTQSGAVPKPAAVLASVLQVDLPSTFGFFEGLMQPFGSGVFFTSSGLINAGH